METKFVMLSPAIDESGNVSVGIIKITTINGESYKSAPWRRAFVKGEALGDSLPTTWGNLPWADFPSERDYILAKWAEIQE